MLPLLIQFTALEIRFKLFDSSAVWGFFNFPFKGALVNMGGYSKGGFLGTDMCVLCTVWTHGEPGKTVCRLRGWGAISVLAGKDRALPQHWLDLPVKWGRLKYSLVPLCLQKQHSYRAPMDQVLVKSLRKGFPPGKLGWWWGVLQVTFFSFFLPSFNFLLSPEILSGSADLSLEQHWRKGCKPFTLLSLHNSRDIDSVYDDALRLSGSPFNPAGAQ